MTNVATRKLDSTFLKLTKSMRLTLEKFDLNRCDERTLYVPVSLSYKKDTVIFDIIYLIDKKDLLGAISLNDHYDHARDFFKRHFNYELYYQDEQYLAKMVSSSPQFKSYLQQYTAQYPKYIHNKSFPIL